MFSKIRFQLTTLMLFLVSSHSFSNELLLSADKIAVEDGDTLLITFDDAVKRVQLLDIDAPENTENAKFKVDMQRTGLDHDTLYAMGTIAADYLAKLLAKGHSYKLIYQAERYDRYGRLLGELMDQAGVSISKKMIVDGYAIANPSQKLDAPHPYEALQLQAAEKKMGLWGLLPKQTQLWSGGVSGQ